MTDAQLIARTQPPTALATAMENQDETGMEQLLGLLFACHAKVDEIEDLGPWQECEAAWDVRMLYEKDQVAPVLLQAAATWEEATQLSEAWLEEWRHDCGEFERWKWRRTELGGPSALAFFRAMMIARCPEARKSIVVGGVGRN